MTFGLQAHVMLRSARACVLTGFLVLLACAAVLACPPRALAQALALRVEIDAPARLAKVLEANLDVVRWSKRTDLTAAQIGQLRRTAPDQIREILSTEGYFTPAIESDLHSEAATRLVRFRIEPGEPARITSVDVQIKGDIQRAADRAERIGEARAAFPIEAGEIFRQADWNAAKTAVVRSLARRVYATAAVSSSKVQVDPAAHTVQMFLQVDSGPPVAFGATKVEGLRRYGPDVIERINPIRPGDPYEEEALVRLQRRLLGMGYFGSAIVTAPANRAKPDNTPVLVNVVEAPSQRVEFGIGVSTDRGPRGQIDYTNNNVLDRAWRFSSNFKIDRLSQAVAGGLQLPRKASGWRYGLTGRFDHEDIQGQEITGWSLTGAHTYTVEEYESAQALQYLTERSQLDGGRADTREALYLSQTWTWNELDDFINPRRGYIATLQIGGASAAVLSTRSFARLHGRASYLYPLGEVWTLGLRAETGLIGAQSRRGIPSAYVFRTGGDTSVRGYPLESIGVPEADAIVGGRYLAVGSLELTRWLTQQWGAAVFYDIGDAWDDWHDFEPVSGYGTGVRWRSPVGNLNFDVAYGEELGSIRVHFSAGFAFR